MGGLLIDTLAHNFLKSTSYYDDKGFLYYDMMSRDFFEYLKDQPNQDHYKALGSGQNVKVKKRFQRKAKKAYQLCLKAIEAGDTDAAHNKWKKIYGRPFPAKVAEEFAKAEAKTWRDTEQYIEDQYPIDIRYDLKLECEVSQHGYREHFLTDMLAKRIPLIANKKLLFTITNINVPEPYTVEWKVLNRGEIAQNRDNIRGQIFEDDGYNRRKESTNFRGEHIVECYAIKNGVVVAKDRIIVPIT